MQGARNALSTQHARPAPEGQRARRRRVPPTGEATELALTGAFRAVTGIDPTPDPLPEASKHVYLLHVTVLSDAAK
ncbi:hypothetical protein GCM10022399_02610 [Terrabacter ginsenosidimutans]|uniref:Uncharacterized protein n=1 Tax=Terrabacter ginsenosidimutans TaxID=490575 RepID=A0ABP7CL57_9MICO